MKRKLYRFYKGEWFVLTGTLWYAGTGLCPTRAEGRHQEALIFNLWVRSSGGLGVAALARYVRCV